MMTAITIFILVFGIFFGLAGFIYGDKQRKKKDIYYQRMCNYYSDYNNLKSSALCQEQDA